MDRENLERYLTENGATSANISAEADNGCDPATQKEGQVTSVSGLNDGEEITRKDLAERKITYKYCVFEDAGEDNNEDMAD